MNTRRLLTCFMILVVVGISSVSLISAQDAPDLTFWSIGDENSAMMYQQVADEWSKTSGLTLKVEPVPWGDAHAKFLTAATSGEGPDLITGGLSYGIEFGSIGGMVNLAEMYPEDVAAMQEASNPGIWASIEDTAGNVFAVPADLTLFLMYYRPDVLEEAGVEAIPPTTWEELTDAITKVRELKGDDGGLTMGWGNTGWIPYQNFLYQAGGTFYNEDCTEVTVNSEEGVAALEFYASLYNDYGASPDANIDVTSNLASGLYPISIMGTWITLGLDSSYPEIVGKWDVAKVPSGPAGNSDAFIGGTVIGVMSYSPNADAAFDFIKYLYTEEAAQMKIDFLATKNSLHIPPQTAFADLMAVPDNVKEAFKSQMAESVGPPNCSGWEEGSKELERQIQTVIFEGADPQEALDYAAEELSLLLSE